LNIAHLHSECDALRSILMTLDYSYTMSE